MLNQQWLLTFKTLVELGSFTRTAEQLFMTQPGVSQHIKKLEQACGYALLQRHRKRFELTDAGKKVYQYSLSLQLQQAELLAALGEDQAFVGECRLACSGALALSLYPKMLRLQQQHSRLSMMLEVAPNQSILQQIQAGTIDMGIVTHLSNEWLFDSEVIGYESLCLLLPASFTAPVTIASLTQLGIIKHPDAMQYLSLFCRQCGNDELLGLPLDSLPISGYVNQLSQILMPVAAGFGFTVLPKSAVDNFALPATIQCYQSPQRVHETLYVVQKRHRLLPTRYQALLEAVRQVIQPAAIG
ncbi:LysR family transcriptional regulator [Shewanella sp. NIFS-20-20]|uniref:LysR family transcriptional regulator n=1 Tax=Shewanella sp. NIFS-20-20 TaxID=2853806 RepID=UPI001C4498BC|nr:LysR family transcriptional regulator [Shewanella sp. NIFS-20-20]